jgi:hypothetical protein
MLVMSNPGPDKLLSSKFTLGAEGSVAAGPVGQPATAQTDAQHYAFAALFGALALLYTPVAPLFSFSGDWQRLIVLASAGPFLASLNSKDGTK